MAPHGREEVACEALVARWKAFRDEEAFRELFELQRPWIEGLLYSILGGDREELGDARQDVLVALLGAIDRFDGRSSFPTFCYRVAKNVAMDRLRRKCRRERLERRIAVLEAPIAETPRFEEPGEVLLREADRRRLRDALDRLGEEDREILLMSAAGDASSAAIAGILGIGEGAARTRLYRARKRLTAAWEECDGRRE